MDEQTTHEDPQGPGIPKPDKRFLMIVAGAVAVLVVIAGIVVWVRSSPSDPQEEARKETEELLATVSEVILLPEGENPIIATVSDPDALGDQEFFDKAEKGDKVLIYNQARKAILYRPSQHRVIEVAPFNAQPSAQ